MSSFRADFSIPFSSLIQHSAPVLVLLLAFLLSVALPATAQDRERQQREVTHFSEVSYSLPGTLHLRQGDERSVEVEASPKTLEEIETEIEGEMLHIRSEHQSNWLLWLLDSEDDLSGSEDIDVYVTAPSVTSLNLAGSGDVVGKTPLEGSSLDINVAGSGNLDLTLNVPDLAINVAGSGTTRLEGQINSVRVSVAGSGDVHLPDTQEINASIAGSGNVWYSGDPEIDSNIFGSGAVRVKE